VKITVTIFGFITSLRSCTVACTLVLDHMLHLTWYGTLSNQRIEKAADIRKYGDEIQILKQKLSS
jgi:hypothetical protein